MCQARFNDLFAWPLTQKHIAPFSGFRIRAYGLCSSVPEKAAVWQTDEGPIQHHPDPSIYRQRGSVRQRAKREQEQAQQRSAAEHNALPRSPKLGEGGRRLGRPAPVRSQTAAQALRVQCILCAPS